MNLKTKVRMVRAMETVARAVNDEDSFIKKGGSLIWANTMI